MSEQEFEKYGVVEKEPDAKTAATDKNLCPNCGQTLLPRDKTNVRVCPHCGTRPFEK